MRATITESKYEPLPGGVYRFIVTDCTEQTNKTTKEKFWSWKVQVNEDTEFNERTASFPTNATKYNDLYKSFLIACGLDTSAFADKEFAIDTDDFIGCEFIAQVKVEPSGSGDRNKFIVFKSIADYQKEVEQASRKFAPHQPAKTANAQTVDISDGPVEVSEDVESSIVPAKPVAPVKPAGAKTVVPVKPTLAKSVTAPAVTGKKLDFPA